MTYKLPSNKVIKINQNNLFFKYQNKSTIIEFLLLGLCQDIKFSIGYTLA